MTHAPLERHRGNCLVGRVWIWTRPLVLGLLALLALVALAGLMFQTSATWLDARRYPPRGQMVEVGGHRLHLVCTGEGTPTIGLEAPIGGSSPATDSLVVSPAHPRSCCCSSRPSPARSDRPGVPHAWTRPSPCDANEAGSSP